MSITRELQYWETLIEGIRLNDDIPAEAIPTGTGWHLMERFAVEDGVAFRWVRECGPLGSARFATA
jgi:hypothetical protein